MVFSYHRRLIEAYHYRGTRSLISIGRDWNGAHACGSNETGKGSFLFLWCPRFVVELSDRGDVSAVNDVFASGDRRGPV